jgi:DNA polymerase III gamma/tau subunit
MMASGDTVLDPDEIAVIVGAPKRVILHTFIKALHEKDVSRALGALHDASESRVDMRIFLTMFLERVRMVMLLRNKALDERSLESVTDDERTLITELARDVKSPINSKLLVRFLEAGNRLGFSSIPELPLELAVVEVTSE